MTSLIPYTSIVTSSQQGHSFLPDILLLKTRLQPRKIDKPVILFGAGNLGKMAKHFFEYTGISFLYVVDEKYLEYSADQHWKNTKIIHLESVEKKDKDNCLLVICVVTAPLINLRDKLAGDGWKDIAFFYDISEAYRDRYPLGNGWFLNPPNERSAQSIQKVFASLHDAVSRSYYEQFIAWRRLRLELLFGDLEVNNNRFFIPEVTKLLRDDEIFVDCGAHKGSVIDMFLKITDNKYKKIYAIEPDQFTFAVLEKKLKNISDTEAIQCALSNKSGQEKFYQGFDFASKLSETGNCFVKTVTLDELNTGATFIKMHLEGGELNALKGSINTIKTHRPILSVTLYHSVEGVWNIPLFLMKNLKNYRYHVRMHSWAGTGAVLYAIPNERLKHNR